MTPLLRRCSPGQGCRWPASRSTEWWWLTVGGRRLLAELLGSGSLAAVVIGHRLQRLSLGGAGLALIEAGGGGD